MTQVAGSLVALAVAIVVGFAGGHGGASWLGIPVMVSCVVLAFAIQWIAFLPAYLLRTERFYDLAGSITYWSVTVAALIAAGDWDARGVLLAAFIGVWSMRLGLFLFRRVHQDGGDGRFDTIKQSAPRFFLAWSLQGLWVSLTLAAALAAITGASRSSLGPIDAVGIALWLAGFAIEVIADRQKRVFRRDPANRGRFIATGLWAWSRHPNYFGEIVLWVGVAVIAASTLHGWQWVTLVSPVFVAVLLLRGSGVPILEARADKRWGGQADYEAYKAGTNVLIPWLPRAYGRDAGPK